MRSVLFVALYPLRYLYWQTRTPDDEPAQAKVLYSSRR
jgi:hypothetical protein